jgi:D-alanyl-D-alanine carboxypeptidase/D-alanyl-D-alanine-endopeptidase (penicillin-binding protein 4)
MKLLTTDAALEMLGPAWSWSTPVWLQGTVQDGVLEGNLVIKGSGDPKLVIERVWLLLRRVQQLGVREIRGDIVLDRSAFDAVEGNPGDFDGEALRPHNVQADALLLNYRSLLMTFTPDPPRGVAIVAIEPTLAGVRRRCHRAARRAVRRLARGAQGRAHRSARLQFAGTYPRPAASCNGPIAYVDPKRYNERMLLGLWREIGGTLTAPCTTAVAPASPPSFVPHVAAAGRGHPRHQQVQQQRDGAAAVPHARVGAARHRHARGRARAAAAMARGALRRGGRRHR